MQELEHCLKAQKAHKVKYDSRSSCYKDKSESHRTLQIKRMIGEDLKQVLSGRDGSVQSTREDSMLTFPKYRP